MFAPVRVFSPGIADAISKQASPSFCIVSIVTAAKVVAKVHERTIA